MEETNSEFYIVGGDWNIALSQQWDTHGYQTENNKNSRNFVINKMEENEYVDIWREQHPKIKRYSWRKTGHAQRARLDFFLISRSLFPFITKTDILPGIDSDHSIILMDIDFRNL